MDGVCSCPDLSTTILDAGLLYDYVDECNDGVEDDYGDDKF